MSKQATDARSKSANDERREPDSDAIVQKSHEVAANLKQATLDRVDTVRRSAQSLRDDTSERVRELGAAVHKVGENFRVEGQQYIAERMTGASQHIRALADYVGSAEISSLVRDTRKIARENTAAFIGGAFLVGLGAGRFLKGTSLMASSVESEPTRSSKPRRTRRKREESDDMLVAHVPSNGGVTTAAIPAENVRAPR